MAPIQVVEISESLQSTTKRVSGRFNDPEADVVFESSDDVLFRIHRKHLDATTAGFAVSPLISSNDDIPVKLTESSEILEILFRFIEPCLESDQYRQPSIINMESQTLFAVAEAAEKYIVFGAMNIFITRMSDAKIYNDHPIEVLNYCAKHGYADLAVARESAYIALSSPR